MNTNTKQKGRPKKQVIWPEDNFLIKDFVALNSPISTACALTKMKEANVKKVGTVKSSVGGRPFNLYSHANKV